MGANPPPGSGDCGEIIAFAILTITAAILIPFFPIISIALLGINGTGKISLAIIRKKNNK